MNHEWVLHHLTEASEELTKTISQIRQQPEYGPGELFVAMSHLYHHINTAWNAREASEDQVRRVSDADFKRWSAFPDDIALFE
jgi:hypothetical protein